MTKFISEELLVEMAKSNQTAQGLLIAAKTTLLHNRKDIQKLLDYKESLSIAIDHERALYNQNLLLMDNDKLADLTGAMLDFGVSTEYADGESMFLEMISVKKEQIDKLEEFVSNLDSIHTNLLYVKRYTELSITNLIDIQNKTNDFSC